MFDWILKGQRRGSASDKRNKEFRTKTFPNTSLARPNSTAASKSSAFSISTANDEQMYLKILNSQMFPHQNLHGRSPKKNTDVPRTHFHVRPFGTLLSDVINLCFLEYEWKKTRSRVAFNMNRL